MGGGRKIDKFSNLKVDDFIYHDIKVFPILSSIIFINYRYFQIRTLLKKSL